MAIVKMAKLQIIGEQADQDAILDTLYITKTAHIKQATNYVGTTVVENKEKIEELRVKLKNVQKCINVLNQFCENIDLKKTTYKFNDFIANAKKISDINITIEQINKLVDNLFRQRNEEIKLKKEELNYLPQKIQNLSSLILNAKTEHLKEDKIKNILKELLEEQKEEVDENYLFALNSIKNKPNKNNFLLEISPENYEKIKIDLDEINSQIKINLNDVGNIEIKYVFAKEHQEKINKLEEEIARIQKLNLVYEKELKTYLSAISDLKYYYDYLTLCMDKEALNSKIAKTKTTFILECFVAKDKVKTIKELIENKFETAMVSQQKISNAEVVPTQTKNNSVIKQAEFVTNMYSIPRANEADPNFSVFFFFMLFFGFIMADIGYGILLTVIGYLLSYKIKEDNGAKRLWKLIGTCGIFTIFWGILFGSFFGFSNEAISFVPKAIMPNPQNDSILLLLICLLMGVCQIIVGYVLRGINAFKKSQYVEGVTNGFAWVGFLTGLVMTVAKLLLDFFKISYDAKVGNILTSIAPVGLYVMIASLVIGILFAGVGTKGIGSKFVKSFSAAYGIINLMSDILSYARLFGLVLSGAIIAQQFNNMGLGLMTSPIGCVLGGLIILIGHAFNVAMSALGAYVHDVRLQYIEYFSKFYTGDGVEFRSFGTELKYITLED